MRSGGNGQPSRLSRQRGRGLPPFLFSPKEVEGELASRPHLKAALGDPRLEGEPSEHFAGYRKSPLQIYRVLANVHYEHLKALVDSLDSCIGRGYEQPRLIRTRGRGDFGSAVSELLVAEHFLLQGFRVKGFDTERGSEPVPDLLVEEEEMRALVEVYSPHEWLALDDLQRDVHEAMQNLDVPFEYHWSWNVEQLAHFDPTSPTPRLLFLHPDVLGDAVEADNARAALVHPMLNQVVAGLLAGDKTTIVAEKDLPEMNVHLRLAIEEAAPRTDAPAREGTHGGPSLSAYRPEAIFEAIVKRTKKKAGRRQALSDGSALEVLVVDLARAKIESELVHDTYKRMFLETLRQKFPGEIPYDVIAFCTARSPGKGLQTHFVVRDQTHVPNEQINRLFGTTL